MHGYVKLRMMQNRKLRVKLLKGLNVRTVLLNIQDSRVMT